MPRSHHRSRPAGSHGTRQVGNSTPADHRSEAQAVVGYGTGLNHRQSINQRKLERWDQGVAEIEARMAQARLSQHYFEPLGRLDSCEKCGLPFGAVQGVKRVHFRHNGMK